MDAEVFLLFTSIPRLVFFCAGDFLGDDGGMQEVDESGHLIVFINKEKKNTLIKQTKGFCFVTDMSVKKRFVVKMIPLHRLGKQGFFFFFLFPHNPVRWMGYHGNAAENLPFQSEVQSFKKGEKSEGC